MSQRRRHKDIFTSAARGSIPAVQQFLARGISINSFNARGTALHHACSRCQNHVVCYLLEQGADVNAVDNNNDTCLILSARRADTTLVTLLLSFGASTTLKNANGLTAKCYTDPTKHPQKIRWENHASTYKAIATLLRRRPPVRPSPSKYTRNYTQNIVDLATAEVEKKRKKRKAKSVATTKVEQPKRIHCHCHCHHHMVEVMATESAAEVAGVVGVIRVAAAEVCFHVQFHQGLAIIVRAQVKPDHHRRNFYHQQTYHFPCLYHHHHHHHHHQQEEKENISHLLCNLDHYYHRLN
jgi:hypothetical protein